MSLPPGFLDELKTRASMAQVAGRKVMWDQRKSNQGKGDMWAPCPFHQEKTASFHVDDRKGYYYCFGCHAKGDVVNFVQETENVTFIEAVEIIAREVGMQMPVRDPQAQAKADRRSQLADVMEQAVQFFRLSLKTAAAGEARDYLKGRGLDEAAQDRWEIGFAPNGWQGLWDHLTGKGVSEDLILDAGLAKPSNQGARPYDTFRNRIMFPIRDARGRAIAFGGRAMDPSDNAKYLNSPETELFDKGRSLYNHGPAREAAGKGTPLVVAEGYMDVIALAEAGFTATVAPLGTAVTEDQLHLLWRISDEPIIALDGDTAGLRAALRVTDLALPLLNGRKSLRFCLMPEGQDPDDFLRSKGEGAMKRELENSISMVELMWRRLVQLRPGEVPSLGKETQIETGITAAVAVIQNDSVRSAYKNTLRNLFRSQRWQWRKGRGETQKRGASSSAKMSALAAAGTAFEDQLREAVILATLVRHPDLVDQFTADLERLTTTRPEHDAVRLALLQTGGGTTDEITAICGEDALEKLTHARHVQIAPGVRPGAGQDVAELSVAEELAKLAARRGAMRELDDALEDFSGAADEVLTTRLRQAAEARNKSEKSGAEDRAEYDLGPNGARIKRDEKQKLTSLLDQIDFSKGRRDRP